MAKSSFDKEKLVKPLSAWEKIKLGVKGFVKGALINLPGSLLFTSIFLGGGKLLAATTSWDPLQMNVFSFGNRLAFSLGLGALIAGGVGAYNALKEGHDQREREMIAQDEAQERKQERGLMRQRLTDVPASAPEPLVAPKDLPLNYNNKLGKLPAHGI